jgi:hypothetical protein
MEGEVALKTVKLVAAIFASERHWFHVVKGVESVPHGDLV